MMEEDGKVALVNGAEFDSAKPGARGIVNAIMRAMLDGEISKRKYEEPKRQTHTTQRPNAPNTALRHVNHPAQHRPVLPLLHSFHFLERTSDLASRRPALVISRISDFFHSAPRAGTVMSSTGPPDDVTAVSSDALGVCGRVWYLKRHK